MKLLERKKLHSLVKVMLKKGAKVDVVSGEGETHLHEAVNTNKYMETVKVLIENGADINAEKKKGHTLLDSAICKWKEKRLMTFLN